MADSDVTMVTPARRVSVEAPHLLLVEGIEEKRFWDAFLQRADIQIIPYGGKNNLSKVLRLVVRDTEFDSVRWFGIAQDADADPGAAFDRICAALRNAGLRPPMRSWESTGPSPEIVAFVLPDGTISGDLETLVWQALQEAPATSCVNAYFECLQRVGLASPRPLSKARIHAYLASLNRPDYRLGEAAEAGVLPLSSPVFAKFIALLPPPA